MLLKQHDEAFGRRIPGSTGAPPKQLQNPVLANASACFPWHGGVENVDCMGEMPWGVEGVP